MAPYRNVAITAEPLVMKIRVEIGPTNALQAALNYAANRVGPIIRKRGLPSHVVDAVDVTVA